MFTRGVREHFNPSNFLVGTFSQILFFPRPNPRIQGLDITFTQKYCSIILDDVALTHMTFSTEFTAAVEQKQIQEQKAEMAKYRVEQAEQIRQANIIRAEGDAQSAKLISDVSVVLTYLFVYEKFFLVLLENG